MTPARLASLLPAVALVAAFGGCRHEEAYVKPPTPVRVEPVTAQPAGAGIRYAATLEPNLKVDLAFKVPGYVGAIAEVTGADGRKRAIQDGDRVTRGMLLATVRQEDVDTKLEQARSREAEANAGLRQAQEALRRAKALYEAKSLTRPDLESAQAAYDSVQARLAGARALVREAQNAVADSSVRSPIDGLVLKRLVEVGSLVGAGTPGFTLADTSRVKAVFGVPDVAIGQVRALERLQVTLEALPGQDLGGRVTRISPVADPKTRAFDVEVTLPNPDGRLKVGMVASLGMPAPGGAQGSSIAVPLTAIVRSPTSPDGYAVYVVVGEGAAARARVRNVTLGEMIGSRVEVTEGLRAGERIVVSGAAIATDGMAVAIVA
jgi:multidrug efflux system membrane fusion protein